MAGHRIDDKLYIVRGVIIPEVTGHLIRDNFYNRVQKAFVVNAKEKLIKNISVIRNFHITTAYFSLCENYHI